MDGAVPEGDQKKEKGSKVTSNYVVEENSPGPIF